MLINLKLYFFSPFGFQFFVSTHIKTFGKKTAIIVLKITEKIISSSGKFFLNFH